MTATTWFGGANVSLQATLVNSSEAISWQLSGPGTLSPTTGLSVSYIPPPSGSFSTQAIIQANTASGLMAQAVVTVGLAPALTVSPTNAMATIGGGAVTLTATTSNFPSPPTLTWALAGAGTLSAMTGTSVQWTPPAAGASGMSIVTVSAPGGLLAMATLAYSPAPTLLLNRTSALALASLQPTPLDLTATLSGSTSAITWTLTGAGSLTAGTGATTRYTPPGTVSSPSGFEDVSITASAGALTATCTVRLYSVQLSDPLVFVSDPPVVLTATVRGAPVAGTWSLFSGPGSIANTVGLTTEYRPPHDPALAGRAVVAFTTTEGVVYSTLTIDSRRNRGLSIVAWGSVPAIVSSTGTLLSATSSFVSTGPSSLITARRNTTGLTVVQVDGLALGARTSAIDVTGWGGARCSLDSAMLDTFVVRCVNATGALQNAAFSFRVVQDRLSAGGTVLAFGQVPSTPPSPSAQSLTAEQASSVTGAVTVTNTSQGLYTLSLGTLPAGVSLGAALVTPTLPRAGDQWCSVSLVSGASVSVACSSQTGTPSNTGFSFSIMGKGAVSEATVDTLTSVPVAPLTTGEVVLDGGVATSGGLTLPSFYRDTAGVYRLMSASSNGGTQVGSLARGAAPVITHATARGAATSCLGRFEAPASTARASTSMTCVDAVGLADTGVETSITSRGRPSLANVTGYAFIDNGGASTTPPAITAFNANGGAITSTRRGVGDYRVTFTNLALTNATAVATAFGAARRCAVESVLADDVDVRCYGATNQPLDSAFFVTAHEWNQVSTARVMAWVRVPALGSAPAPAFSSNPGGPVTVQRTGTGTFAVTLTGLTAADGRSLSVTAENSNRFCSILSRNLPVVAVQCHDDVGPADSDFSLVVFTDQPFTSLTQPVTHAEVLAFAFANDPMSASYTPVVTSSYNSARQAIVASRSGPGVYAMRFPGLAFESGVVQVSPADTGNQCVVLAQATDTVSVRCFSSAGLPADTRYRLAFVR